SLTSSVPLASRSPLGMKVAVTVWLTVPVLSVKGGVPTGVPRSAPPSSTDFTLNFLLCGVTVKVTGTPAGTPPVAGSTATSWVMAPWGVDTVETIFTCAVPLRLRVIGGGGVVPAPNGCTAESIGTRAMVATRAALAAGRGLKVVVTLQVPFGGKVTAPEQFMAGA